MLSEVKGWYYGWKATLRLMIFDRETCRYLKEPFVIGDFGEVPSPDEVHQRWVEGLKERICSHCGAVIQKEIGLWRATATGKFMCPDGLAHQAGTAGFGELDFEHGSKMPRFGSDERE